jgi:hypothetical protein
MSYSVQQSQSGSQAGRTNSDLIKVTELDSSDIFSDGMADLEQQLELFTKSTYIPTQEESLISTEKKNNLVIEVYSLFARTFKDLISRGGPGALFTGAVPRLLFFAPASMIFFATYETFFDLILASRVK